MKYTAPPYMHDVLPFELEKDGWLHVSRWQAVETVFRETCRQFGYREIRTPVMESTDLFVRTVGEGTDIVSKEMFTFTDRGDRSMTLRPEGTAPAIRAYLEHNLAGQGGATKLYYISTIYRYERGQRGRYREHQQTGVELLGSASPAADAEVIGLALEFYHRLGIENTELRINSVGCRDCRPTYREALVAFAEPLLAGMSEDNRRRFTDNPLRMLDSKDENDRASLAGCPKLIDHLCEECRTHFEQVKSLLQSIHVRFEVDTNLVRGFDYYTKTAFEIVSPELGAQNVIGGGGRYDGLVEEIGGPATPGIGFGIGTERCLLVLDQLGKQLPIADERPWIALIPLGEAAKDQAFRLLMELRRAGVAATMDLDGKSMKSQMRQANRDNARYVAILGENELSSGQAALKNMVTSEQDFVALEELVGWVQEAVSRG